MSVNLTQRIQSGKYADVMNVELPRSLFTPKEDILPDYINPVFLQTNQKRVWVKSLGFLKKNKEKLFWNGLGERTAGIYE